MMDRTLVQSSSKSALYFPERFLGPFLFRWIDDIISSESCRLEKHSVWRVFLQNLFCFNSIRDDDANAKLHIEFEGGIEEKDNKGFHMSSQREHGNYIPPCHTTNRVSLSLNASLLTIQDPLSVAQLFSSRVLKLSFCKSLFVLLQLLKSVQTAQPRFLIAQWILFFKEAPKIH